MARKRSAEALVRPAMPARPGAVAAGNGRDVKKTTLDLDRGLDRQLCDWALDTGVSKSELLRAAIRLAMADAPTRVRIETVAIEARRLRAEATFVRSAP